MSPASTPGIVPGAPAPVFQSDPRVPVAPAGPAGPGGPWGPAAPVVAPPVRRGGRTCIGFVTTESIAAAVLLPTARVGYSVALRASRSISAPTYGSAPHHGSKPPS